MQKRKKCTTVNQLYLFFYVNLFHLRPKFVCFIVISHENTEKILLSLNVNLSALKWGQRLSATIRAILQTVFRYFILSNNKKFFKLLKKGKILS